MIALAIGASLWLAASQAGARVPVCVPGVDSPGCVDGRLVPATPIEQIADGLAIDLVLNAGGSGADLLSTQYGLDNGCMEGNPLGRGPDGRVALKMGAAALRGAVSYVLRRTGHKTAADVWRYAGLAADFAITTNNIVCGRRNGK